MPSIVQERIKVISEIKFKDIQKMMMICKKDEHGCVEIEGTIENDVSTYEINNCFRSKVKIYDIVDREELLFSGIIKQAELNCKGMVCTIRLLCYSQTILLDEEEKNCSYQRKGLTYLQIIQDIVNESTESKVICDVKDSKIGTPIIRYKETDWEFIKRLASHMGSSIFPLVNENGVGISIGQVKRRGITPDKFVNIKFIISEDKSLFYEIKNQEKWCIGDFVVHNGRKLYVNEKRAIFSEGTLNYIYLFTDEKYMNKKTYENRRLRGISLKGRVIDVENEKVKLHLIMDKEQEIEDAYWFPYLPDTGNIMYSMPEIDDMVCLYLGCGWEKDAIVIHCIREGAGEQKGAFLISPYEKKVLFDEKKIGYDSASEEGNGRFLLQDEEIIVQDSRKVKIIAEKRLSVQAGNLQVIAPEEVTLMKRDMIQPSVINLCNTVDIIAEGSEIQCSKEMSDIRTISDDVDEEVYDLQKIKKDIWAVIPFDGVQDSVANCLIKSFRYIDEER